MVFQLVKISFPLSLIYILLDIRNKIYFSNNCKILQYEFAGFQNYSIKQQRFDSGIM